VAVLGASGLVGQRIVHMLSDHPWFRVAEVVASDRRAGACYGDSVDWRPTPEPPDAVAGLTLRRLEDDVAASVVLSALPADEARQVETRLAAGGHLVCTNASAHRMDPTVPLVIPEVNPSALDLARRQAWHAGGGAIVGNPNCVVAGLAMALAPLDRLWGIESVGVVTLQAISGAGSAGPTAFAMTGNVVPWIDGEERKISSELLRILGRQLDVAVTVNRVPVLDGHMAHVYLNFQRPPKIEDVVGALSSFRPPPEARGLPSIPEHPVVVRMEHDRPQPRRDAMAGAGMAVTVGRIRSAPPFHLAMTVVSHNLIRGAAGACIANAELSVARHVTRSRTAPAASSSGPSP
jgi:aspartate-semialdehyde dehydrogenase